MNVLNIGAGPKGIPLPPHYQGWDEVRLDIEPSYEPNILMDARNLGQLDAGQFDAAYISHNLEHYYPHEVMGVLRGMLHVLAEDGFAEIRVPDVIAAMRAAVFDNGDLDTFLYQSAAGPVVVHDVMWGYPAYTETMGPAMGHKTGFSERTLRRALFDAGYNEVYMLERNFELRAIACKGELGAEMVERLGVVIEEVS